LFTKNSIFSPAPLTLADVAVSTIGGAAAGGGACAVIVGTTMVAAATARIAAVYLCFMSWNPFSVVSRPVLPAWRT
jgi:hypothetical protein